MHRSATSHGNKGPSPAKRVAYFLVGESTVRKRVRPISEDVELGFSGAGAFRGFARGSHVRAHAIGNWPKHPTVAAVAAKSWTSGAR